MAAISASLPTGSCLGQCFSVVHIKGLALPFHPHTLLDHIPTSIRVGPSQRPLEIGSCRNACPTQCRPIADKYQHGWLNGSVWIILHGQFRVELHHARTVGDVKFREVGVFDVLHELVLMVANDRCVIGQIPISQSGTGCVLPFAGRCIKSYRTILARIIGGRNDAIKGSQIIWSHDSPDSSVKYKASDFVLLQLLIKPCLDGAIVTTSKN